MTVKSVAIRVVPIVLAVCVLISGIGLLLAWQPVDEGNVKVVTEFGAEKTVLYPGPNWVNPVTQDVKKISVRPHLVDQSGTQTINVQTRDGQPASVDVSVLVRVKSDRENVLTFYREKNNWESANSSVVVPALRSETRTAAGYLDATEIFTGQGREAMSLDLRDRMNAKLAPFGMEVVSVDVRNVNLDSEYEDSIRQKEIKKQELERKEFEIQIAEREKERRLINAEASAEEVRIAAQAEADSNDILGDSYARNPELLEYRWLESLDSGDQIYFFEGNVSRPVFTKGIR